MAKKSAKELLKSFGKNISAKELKKFETKGFNLDKAKSFAKETGGTRFNEGAKKYYQASKKPVTTSGPGPGNDGAGTPGYTPGGNGNDGLDFMSQNEFDYQSADGLAELDGQIRSNLTKIQNQNAEAVAGIYAKAQMYGTDADERARKYVADRAGSSAEAVENIRAKNNIDLQAIVNAGLKEVEGIRGQFGVEQEKTRGEYGVKQEETRQAGSRDIARIGGRTGIYQGLLGAFNF